MKLDNQIINYLLVLVLSIELFQVDICHEYLYI